MTFRIISVIGLLLLSFLCHGRDSFFSTPSNTSWFGGPQLKYAEIGSDGRFMLGAKGGTVFGNDIHAFYIGGAGYGMLEPVSIADSEDYTFVYGGLILGYTYQPEKLVHWKSECLLGAGNITILDDNRVKGDKNYSVLLGELYGGAEFNVTDFLQVGVGAFYRLSTEPDHEGISADDLSGPGISIDFEFGYFH
ncbi:hypothetical protein [Gynuella sp.]|uniref:hypothetical protein n=1 Tax=Gynuella sp. TaxID=2969146 RepID=UPI003D14AECF